MKFNVNTSYKRPKSFSELVADDPFHLLENIGEKRSSMSISERVKEDFEQIAVFVKTNQRMPSFDSDNFDEVLLAQSFDALVKQSPEGKSYCESFLKEQPKESSVLVVRRHLSREEKLDKQIENMGTRLYNNFNDILQDDPLGLLDNVSGKPVEHESWRDEISEKKQGKSADNIVARTVPCEDFFRYEKYFVAINNNLNEHHLEAKNVVGDSAEISLGDIFVINGTMSVITQTWEEKAFSSRVSRKKQYRVRQLFANGTVQEPYSVSIKSSFYKEDSHSKRIVPVDIKGYDFINKMVSELNEINNGEGNRVLTGYIYILSSLSTNPTIRQFSANSSLVKIGYTTVDVKTRIANAEREPTYLCAPVKVLKTYRCYNFDARNLEDVLHTILAEHRLNVTLKDKEGIAFRPKEWFTVSVETSDQIIDHIIKGDINQYYVDKIQGKLKHKTTSNSN